MFRSVRSKTIMVMIMVTASTAILITMIFYRRSAEMIEENYVENLYARIRHTGETLDESMEDIYFLAVQASCDEEVRDKTAEYLSAGKEEQLSGIAERLRNYAGRNNDIGSVYLSIGEKRTVVTSMDYPVYQKDISDKKIEEIEEIGKTTLTPALIRDPLRESDHILVFASPVEDDDGNICAYIMANLNERALYYKYLDGLEDGKTSKAALLDGDGRIVAAKKPEKLGQICETEPEDEQKVLSVRYQTDFAGYSFWMEREKNEVLADLREVRLFLAVILLTVLGIGVILIIFITRAMYRPLKKLTETMEMVSDGGLEQRVEVSTKDEIGILSRDFNDMLEHIESLIEQLIQEEMLKRDAELEALQYQITPHFMYNTLNSIKYAALLKGEEEIGGLIGDFIELLQASISKKGRFVTVAEELHFVENYINLQRMRYEEEIVVDYQIRPEVLACFLPRLMLQPLVENAILHGLDLKAGRNRIVIGVEIESGETESENTEGEGMLCLWVKDNGRGMTKEQKMQFLQGKKKENGLSKIGMANVGERLKLYYGDAGQIACESSEEGTRICIYLPAYRERDRYAL